MKAALSSPAWRRPGIDFNAMRWAREKSSQVPRYRGQDGNPASICPNDGNWQHPWGQAVAILITWFVFAALKCHAKSRQEVFQAALTPRTLMVLIPGPLPWKSMYLQ